MKRRQRPLHAIDLSGFIVDQNLQGIMRFLGELGVAIAIAAFAIVKPATDIAGPP